MIKMSIILPSLNVAGDIEDCLNSVVNQTMSDIEIICVDAGSTDGTLEVIASFAKNDARIILLHSDEKSYGKQVNMGIRCARGKYIGIVETDDFVAENMYQTLYEAASKHGYPDMVKANWDEFIKQDGERRFTYAALLKDHAELYDKIVSAREYPWLYVRDITVWKGIYRKDFLTENELYFNESRGAAYQDCGFAVLALSCAESIVYLPQSLYRYQKSREGASSWNPSILQFVWQEWRRLWEENTLPEEYKGNPYVVQRMADSFIGELDKALKIHEFNVSSDYIQPYYQWFKKQLEKIMESVSLPCRVENREQWKRLRLALYSLEAYRALCMVECRIQNEDRKKITDWSDGKEVLIFGCGNYGQRAYDMLRNENIRILAFCDNDRRLWGSKMNSLPVLSLEKGIQKYPNSGWLIANKSHWKEIKKQLDNSGIREEEIQIFI